MRAQLTALAGLSFAAAERDMALNAKESNMVKAPPAVAISTNQAAVLNETATLYAAS
jgi:hypothetical protein